MTSYEWLIVVHVLAVTVWLGGALTGTLIGARIAAQGSADLMGRFCTAFATIAGPLFGGSAMLVLLSGIGMVTMSGGPEFSDLWVTLGTVGWLVSTVLGATIVGRSWQRVGQELAADGASMEAAAPRIARAQRLTYFDIALRTALVVLMVWRPV